MADISMFATKDNANEGVIFPVILNGKKLPMALRIYGDDADIVHDYNKQKLRKMKINKGGLELDEETMEELLDSDENILVRIGGIYSYDWSVMDVVENDDVELFGKKLKNDEKSYAFLIYKIPAIKDFVLEKSNARTNFLDKGKKD